MPINNEASLSNNQTTTTVASVNVNSTTQTISNTQSPTISQQRPQIPNSYTSEQKSLPRPSIPSSFITKEDGL